MCLDNTVYKAQEFLCLPNCHVSTCSLSPSLHSWELPSQLTALKGLPKHRDQWSFSVPVSSQSSTTHSIVTFLALIIPLFLRSDLMCKIPSNFVGIPVLPEFFEHVHEVLLVSPRTRERNVTEPRVRNLPVRSERDCQVTTIEACARGVVGVSTGEGEECDGTSSTESPGKK
ncbi:hypothetical protein J6590_009853 [Homalodisca vitripennis]|nr:hypothetical protein J6590_009853 [Homalodisca vitripennis]